jgi:hypothetical protein
MRSVKFLKITSFYNNYLENFYNSHPNLSELTYDRHYNLLMNDCFSWADFFENNLNSSEYVANQIVINDIKLQKKWGDEHNISFNRINWKKNILRAQICYYNPTILFFEDMSCLDRELYDFIYQFNPKILLIGHYCAPATKTETLKKFDLVISCTDLFSNEIKKLNLKTELVYHCFEKTIVEKIGNVPKVWDFTFIGSLNLHKGFHLNRYQLIKQIFERTNLELWTPIPTIRASIFNKGLSFFQGNILRNFCPNGKNEYPIDSVVNLKEKYPHRIHQPVYGLEMYRVLAQSKITLNCHIDGAGDYAGNLRLFEATGMGTLLITDWKKNISDLFEPDKEVITYKTPEECVEKVQYYLEHDKEREAIARAGQKRTLKDHTWENRMTDLKVIFENYLAFKK